jgi:hypothetical protein
LDHNPAARGYTNDQKGVLIGDKYSVLIQYVNLPKQRLTKLRAMNNMAVLGEV